MGQFETHRCRLEYALKRAYCSLSSRRALAPEVNLSLTSAAEAEAREGISTARLKACSTQDYLTTTSE